jgi:hypothetical protein
MSRSVATASALKTPARIHPPMSSARRRRSMRRNSTVNQ